MSYRIILIGFIFLYGCKPNITEKLSSSYLFAFTNTKNLEFSNISYKKVLEFRDKFKPGDISNCYGDWIAGKIGSIDSLADLESIYWLSLSLKYYATSNVFREFKCAPDLEAKFCFFDSLPKLFRQYPSEVFCMYYGYYQYGVGAADGEYYLENFKEKFYPDDEVFYVKALLGTKKMEKYFVERERV